MHYNSKHVIILLLFIVQRSVLSAQWNMVHDFYQDSIYNYPGGVAKDVKTAKSVVFFNDTVGYTVLTKRTVSPFYIPQFTGTELRTTDGGITWNAIGPSAGYLRFDFKKHGRDSLACLKGNDAELLAYHYSFNHGTYWINVATSLGATPQCGFHFRDNKNAYFSMGSSYYKMMSNVKYPTFISSTNYNLTNSKVHMLDGNNALCIVDTAKRLVMTQDSGYSWNTSYYSSIKKTELYFTNDLNGYVTCDSGKVLSTKNGCANWSITQASTNRMLTAVDFLNDSTGMVGGVHGELFSTRNGGLTWNSENLPDTTDVKAIQFADNYVYVLTDNGKLYKKTINSLVSVREISNDGFGFMYPNPVTMNQEFHITSQRTIVRYEIFDMLGRLEAAGLYQHLGNTYSGKITTGPGEKILVSYDESDRKVVQKFIVR